MLMRETDKNKSDTHTCAHAHTRHNPEGDDTKGDSQTLSSGASRCLPLSSACNMHRTQGKSRNGGPCTVRLDLNL